MRKITAFSVHTTAEGERAAFTYSDIDENGTITAQNKRGEVILIDEDALAAAQTLYDFLLKKAQEGQG